MELGFNEFDLAKFNNTNHRFDIPVFGDGEMDGEIDCPQFRPCVNILPRHYLALIFGGHSFAEFAGG